MALYFTAVLGRQVQYDRNPSVPKHKRRNQSVVLIFAFMFSQNDPGSLFVQLTYPPKMRREARALGHLNNFQKTFALGQEMKSRLL